MHIVIGSLHFVHDVLYIVLKRSQYTAASRWLKWQFRLIRIFYQVSTRIICAVKSELLNTEQYKYLHKNHHVSTSNSISLHL